MPPASSSVSRPPVPRLLLVAGIVLISINLRPALAAVGPLVADVRADTGLSNTALGLLTTLPLLAFGGVSALTPLVTRRLGIEGTLGAALGLLAGGLALRAAPSVVLLFVGTALAGTAIALGNVLLPSLVKRDFPDRAGVMTSVYSSGMGIGASLAAGVSVPLAAWLGWRGALGAWAVPALVALAVWLPMLRRRTPPPKTTVGFGQALGRLGRSPVAWAVALFMGLQSLSFYVLLAWLPELLVSRGLDAGYAGWMLALSQAAGIAGTVAGPLWAERTTDQRPIVWALLAAEAVSLVGLLLPGTALVPLWVSAIGFTLGGTFGLALMFIVLRTATTEDATALSGMAQSAGYLVAAVGPLAFGFLYDRTGAWTVPMAFLMVVAAGKLIAGLAAAAPRRIGG